MKGGVALGCGRLCTIAYFTSLLMLLTFGDYKITTFTIDTPLLFQRPNNQVLYCIILQTSLFTSPHNRHHHHHHHHHCAKTAAWDGIWYEISLITLRDIKSKVCQEGEERFIICLTHFLSSWSVILLKGVTSHIRRTSHQIEHLHRTCCCHGTSSILHSSSHGASASRCTSKKYEFKA